MNSTPSGNTRQRLTLIASLYVAQAIPLGFIIVALIAVAIVAGRLTDSSAAPSGERVHVLPTSS